MNSKLASPELLAAIAAATGTVGVIIKKLLSRKPRRPRPEYITRAEFHLGLDAVRDRIAAGYMAVTDKMDANHSEIERRLDNLETSLARLDERTKTSP